METQAIVVLLSSYPKYRVTNTKADFKCREKKIIKCVLVFIETITPKWHFVSEFPLGMCLGNANSEIKKDLQPDRARDFS